ncbi:aminotransferase class I/II-fold pyridoxal phosphate-dependent enzyme [Pseudobacter ginsenosidimutans]|uniref:8-amino-7-oxononanoate synthase n=1 Tax=Pseudobacter ginsenosidimutans TaxID=661488 RepID=A0A4Q7N5M6_9BACT|nr:8-amino-7-oxononanoate synthase [Pseudobacter ginsenosidimutans]QEC44865.1 8-amino-7-oxononanoate synthase [Pseudobacter ginsenosidimutans]RZS76356.1 8-amino-7-oxononanoate synthase [Pseudobacter ginsenosidimutans]
MRQENFLEKKLQERRDQQAFRTLKLPTGKTDFCSNDYLGIIHYGLLETSEAHWLKHGSGGSRLLAGNDALTESTEQQLAGFHQSEAALLYNSGYDANLGLLSAVPQRGDTIIYDYLSHASIRDGIRLSFAQSFSFRHNDLAELEKKLQSATGNIFVVTESVFSMDGDQAPLEEMTTLCEKYNAHLIVDEAHATGVIGERGEGLVQHLQLQQRIFARVVTFGKAVGCHGAVVLGSRLLRDYLINFSRSFIYTTALPQASVRAIRDAYALFPQMKKERILLASMIKMFQEAILPFEKLLSSTPIQVVVIPGNEAVKSIAGKLQDAGMDVRPILYPTVPKGGERLRIVLHAFNTETEVKKLISHFD